jgi:hypothetical protein
VSICGNAEFRMENAAKKSRSIYRMVFSRRYRSRVISARTTVAAPG